MHDERMCPLTPPQSMDDPRINDDLGLAADIVSHIPPQPVVLSDGEQEAENE